MNRNTPALLTRLCTTACDTQNYYHGYLMFVTEVRNHWQKVAECIDKTACVVINYLQPPGWSSVSPYSLHVPNASDNIHLTCYTLKPNNLL